VFDEIHAYDDSMFGALLRFLGDVPGIPVLLMTASLPIARRARLEALCAKLHGRSLHVVKGPADLEAIPRYVRARSDDVWMEVEACQRAGGKVLYVSNTVDRCLAAAKSAADRDLAASVYHSRFRYLDRVARHSELIESFRRPGAALALTTQVAEMSLDLSADLLVTDLAPIPALIQRLGRLHRRATTANPGTPKPFIVLENPSSLPYDEGDLRQARAWLDRLGDQPRSQSDLVEAWKDDVSGVLEVASTWFDGGFRSEPGEVRDPGPGIQVLLAADADAVRGGSLEAVAAALPMLPPRHSWLSWPRVDGYVVAPVGSVEYDARMGARWV
jgi:CRISPR-associated endonuclease/helicase Cas3